MRFAWLLAIAACGDNAQPPPGADAPPDAPPDPFAGMFTSPADFPHTNCTPGSLAGFAYAAYYPDASLRTAFDSELHTFMATYLDEVEVTPLLTPDDLLVRSTQLYGSTWELIAI